jgi:23S rRNA pseudouridine1911/1915/1917 synthase
MLIRVSPEEPPERIDRFLSRKTGISRNRIQRLIEDSRIKVNNACVRTRYIICGNDSIEVVIPKTGLVGLQPDDIALDILYRDGHIVVVNKPPGMVVHPGAGRTGGTLMNALRFHMDELATVGGPLRPGVVHRLDKDTSGVMVVALTDTAYYGLVKQFSGRTVGRRYIALIYGTPKADKGEITLNIGRSRSDRKKMSTRSRRAREARTSWKIIQRLQQAALVEARLATGRTHQIRVHFASLGHSVLGDRTYGRKTNLRIGQQTVRFPRQMLHAELLGITHPVTGEDLEFVTAMPDDMREAVIQLGG